jgi:5'-methylthioadenosine phosphorylase
VANAETARKVILHVIAQIPTKPNWPEHFALDTALITDGKLWPETTVEKLKPILERFLRKNDEIRILNDETNPNA